MTKEFTSKKYKDATVYTLENASAGATSSSSVGTGLAKRMGPVISRGGLVTSEEKKEPPKPRNFVAKNAKMGGAGAHKDKKKEQKQGKEKHRKPYMEELKDRIAELKSRLEENDLAQQMMALARSKGMNPRLAGTPEQERERTQQMMAQRAKDREEQGRQSAQADAAKLPELKAEYERMKKEYQSLGGSNWQYADREQNLSGAERKARSMEPELRNLGQRIARAEKAGMDEDHSTVGGWGHGAYDSYANTRHGRGVAEDAPFGSNYAEQLAQQVFDHNPNIDDENQVLDLGYNISKSDLGSRAQGMFRNKDFPSDFVSAYFYLQKQGVAEVSDATLTSYLTKVDADSQKHEKDPSKRSPEKRNKSVQGFSRAFNKLDARKEKGVAENPMTQDTDMSQVPTGDNDSEAEGGFVKNQIHTMMRVMKHLEHALDDEEDLPEWVEMKISQSQEMLVSVMNYIISEKERNKEVDTGRDEMMAELAAKVAESDDYFAHLENMLNEDWQKVNKRDKTDGMSRKAVNAYRRENPGSKLKTAVTTKPSKLKKGSKSAKRRKSFCARMSGMKKAHASAKTKRDPDSPINKALRRWNCEEDVYMNSLAQQVSEKLNPQADVDVWVQDFQKADPNKYHQFKNKTPQKKAQMAVAAHYAANEPSKKK